MNHPFSRLRDFKIEVQYFKESGKLGYFDEFTFPFTNCGSEEHPTCYMSEVVGYLKDCNAKGTLPGLRSGKWEHIIWVNCEEGFPVLIIPR